MYVLNIVAVLSILIVVFYVRHLHTFSDLPDEITVLIKEAEISKNLGNVSEEADLLKLAAEKAENVYVDKNTIAWIWRYCGDAYHRTFNIIECLRAMYNAISHFREIGSLKNEFMLHGFLSHVYLQSGDFVDALEELEESGKILSKTNDKEMNKWLNQSWALYFSYVGEPYKSIQYYKDVLREFSKIENDPFIGGCYINIGLSYCELNVVEKAIDYLQKAVDFSEVIDTDSCDSRGLIINAKLALAETYNYFRIHTDESISLLEVALTDCFRFSMLQYEPLVRKALADAFEIKEEYNRSKEQLSIVKELLANNGNTRKRSDVLLQLAKISYRTNNISESIDYFNEYSDLIIQDQKNIQKQRAVEVEVRLFRLDEKRKNEILERELQIKQRVNEAITLHNESNEEFILKIHKKLTHIESKANNSYKKEIKQLQQEIKETLSLKKEWNSFEEGYVNSNNALERKLSKDFPNLTTTERKVCILLQAGRSTKEIATLLHVSPDTIDTHRIHIRRKMGLQPKTSILTALSAL